MGSKEANKNGKEFEEVNDIVKHLKNISGITINEVLSKKINKKKIIVIM